MRLTKLEIRGFKSFRDKTVIEFPDEFTAIVGPNGSGKSNIVDAICFVLGKSRGLRANKLTELIYNGGIGGGLFFLQVAEVNKLTFIIKAYLKFIKDRFPAQQVECNSEFI